MLFRCNGFPVSFPSEDSASAPSSTKKGLSLHPLVSSTLGQGTPVPLRHEVSRSLLERGAYSPPAQREPGPQGTVVQVVHGTLLHCVGPEGAIRSNSHPRWKCLLKAISRRSK